MNKYLVEFIGTFFLVFTVANVVIGTATPELAAGFGPLGPLAIASSLMVMIFAGGHISGGHFNPAVTLAVTMRGKCSPADAIPYVVAQCLGAIIAALAGLFLRGSLPADAALPLVATGAPKVLLAELLITFALAYTVLNVATAKGTSGNSFYGLAIGFVVLVGAVSVGGISGGAFNPAVSVGLGTIKKLNWPDIWMHIAPQLVAGALAAIVFRFVNGVDEDNA